MAIGEYMHDSMYPSGGAAAEDCRCNTVPHDVLTRLSGDSSVPYALVSLKDRERAMGDEWVP